MKATGFLVLVGVIAAVCGAAVREPVGVWDFDPADPNAATVGADLGLVGSVEAAAGLDAEDGAVLIGVGSHFECRHGIAPNGGGAMVNAWTLLVDFRYPAQNVGQYVDFLQTDPANTPGNDSDWTVAAADGAIGISAVGYSRQTGFYSQPDTWYRMVMSVENGVRHDLFIDGDQVLRGNALAVDGRFGLADVLLLFAANDGDDRDMIVTRVAMWDVPLTAGEAIALGDPNYGLLAENKGPDVNAGADQEVELDASGSMAIALDGAVSDDGAYSVVWTQVSGPAAAIGDAASEDTSLTITAPGRYVMQLTADDGEFALSDTMTLVVHPYNYAGLIVHWDFEETWDGATVQDVSSHENHGRVLAGVGQALYIAEGVDGQALDLRNGPDATVGDAVALDMVMPDAGTVALWFKPHAMYNYNSVFDNSVQQDDWEMWIYGDGRLRFRVQAGTEVTANLTQLAQGQNPLDLWWHMTLTWDRLDASTVRTQMYVNGSLTEEKTGPWVNPGATFYLGGGHPGNEFAYGAVDDFRIYNRVVTAKEALALVFGENLPPEVDAGGDQEFEMDEASTPVVVTLDGTVTDIGEIAVGWSKISGPNDITFADAGAEDTTATITAPGRYTLELAANDGEYAASDTLMVVVHPHGYDGQILHWDFETDSGGQVFDVSGHRSHGAIIDGPSGATAYTDGKMGRSLSLLNGDYMTGGDHVAVDLRLPARGTIALWYNPQSLYNWNAVFDNSRDGDDWEMWLYADGVVRFRVDDTAIVSANLHAMAPAEDPTPVGKWWHIAVTWDRVSETQVAIKMFVNGALIEENVGPWIDPGASFYLGGGNAGNDYAHCMADELYIYDRPLELVEVLGLMYRGNKPPIVDAGPDLVKWLDESGELSVPLAGSVIDSGGPSDLLIGWTQISGPNDIIIDDPTQPNTWATIRSAGIYHLQIDANDGEFYAADDMFIEVYPAGYTGLIAHWPFDSDTLEDASGNGNDGTLVDGAASESGYVKGKLGRAWRPGNGDFATDGDYVSLGLTMPETGTVAFWYQVNTLYNYAALFDNSVQQDDWEMWIYDRGEARFRIQAGGEVSANLHALSADGDARGDWFHFAVTWKRLSPTTVENSLYVNGQLIQSRVGPWVDPGTTFYLGGGHDGNDYGDGLWDEVRLYERALTAGEVRLLASLSDFDGDMDLDLSDLRFFVERWRFLEETGQCVSTPAADYNMDCAIDLQDFAAFGEWWMGGAYVEPIVPLD